MSVRTSPYSTRKPVLADRLDLGDGLRGVDSDVTPYSGIICSQSFRNSFVFNISLLCCRKNTVTYVISSG